MHQMRYSTTCPSQFAWQYEWLWFNIGVLRAKYAHRSNLSKPDILQTSVWLNDRKKSSWKRWRQPNNQTNPSSTTDAHGKFTARFSLTLFTSSILFLHQFDIHKWFFFLIVFFILILPLASYQYAYWKFFFFCFLLLFATIVLVPHVRQICALFLFCVYAVLTIIFFSSSSSSSSCSVICVLCVVRCRSLDLTMHICTTHARVIRIQV